MKQSSFFIALASALVLSACTSTVSRGVQADGSVEELVWPSQADSWRKAPLRLAAANIANVKVGLERSNVFDLLDVPHFSEINGAREWNYIFQRPEYTPENPAVCHMKLIYDNDDRVAAIYWLPEDCAEVYGGSESFSLSADALFDFNASRLRAGAESELDALANALRSKGGDGQITVTGYTDRLGNASYNRELSRERAQSVRDYLVSAGIAGERIRVEGLGSANPLSDCSDSLPRAELISCLQPDRRVEITVSGVSRR